MPLQSKLSDQLDRSRVGFALQYLEIVLGQRVVQRSEPEAAKCRDGVHFIRFLWGMRRPHAVATDVPLLTPAQRCRELAVSLMAHMVSCTNGTIYETPLKVGFELND
jgi:hypothetical protein